VITALIGVNFTIALLSFYLAWRLQGWRQQLATLADALTTWEHSTHNALNPATRTGLGLRGQPQIALLRQQYAHLQALLKQWQQVMAILSTVLSLSRWLGLTGRRQQARLVPKRQPRLFKHRASRERR